MAVRELAPGVHQVPLGGVNAFLLDDGDALTLIDAGLPKRDRRVLAAIQGLGRRPLDVRDIVTSDAAATIRSTIARVAGGR